MNIITKIAICRSLWKSRGACLWRWGGCTNICTVWPGWTAIFRWTAYYYAYIEELQDKFYAPISRDITCGFSVYAEKQYDEAFLIPTDYIGKDEYFWFRAKGQLYDQCGNRQWWPSFDAHAEYRQWGRYRRCFHRWFSCAQTLSYHRTNRRIVLITKNDDKENHPNQI